MSGQGQGPENSNMLGPRSVGDKSSEFIPHALGSAVPPRGTSVVLGSFTASHFLTHMAAAATSAPTHI